MATKAQETIYYADGAFDWSGGVDSSKATTIASSLNPNGLARNQLAWLINATVRNGGITQRPGWQPLVNAVKQSGFYWQGGYMYQPDNGYPYLVCQISGVLYAIQLVSPYTVTDLTVGNAALRNPSAPNVAETCWFVQAENYLIVQAGDYYTAATPTLPLIWDGSVLRRSLGITNPAPAIQPGVNEIPAAAQMDYYGGHIWYAQGRSVSAGDMVGGPSGTQANHYRDSILSVTENPLCFGGDGFSIPTNGGNIRALRHSSAIGATSGQGQFFILTRKVVYALSVPVTRLDWINATATNQPQLTVVQIDNGAVGDRCVVSVNGDLFYMGLEPSVRSLVMAQRYFEQWGNTVISQNENRILQNNDRSLMRFSSGMNWDSRLWMLALPQLAADGVNVIHKGVMPLDFDIVSNLSGESSPVWEGAYSGLNHIQIFTADFGGLPRAFSAIISDVDGSLNIWELTDYSEMENGDNRVTWSVEFPAFTWASSKLEYELKRLSGGELWVDQIVGTVEIDSYYRQDADPCWHLWSHCQVCAGRCGEQDPPLDCYPETAIQAGYAFPVVFPEAKGVADAMGVRPSTNAYQFQVRVVVKGYMRIRGLMLYAWPLEKPQFQGICCPSNVPQGMARLPNPFIDSGTGYSASGGTGGGGSSGGGTTSPPSQVTDPYPADGETGVSNTQLSWEGAANATSYNVYLNGQLKASQAATTFNPGSLSLNTAYSWRVDSVNANGVTVGADWSFTTGASAAFSYDDPSIVIGWTDDTGYHTGNLAAFQSTAHPSKVTSLSIPAYPTLSPVNVTSITGLGSLPLLQSLSCPNCMLTSLDVSQNPLLTNCDAGTQATTLTSINVSGCPLLSYLDCSANTNGTGGGSLASLDLSHNPALTHCYCFNNQIKSLDISQNLSLQFLGCSYNSLTVLDLTNHLFLQYVRASNNSFGSAAVDNILCEMKTNMIGNHYNHNLARGVDVSSSAAPGPTGLACAQILTGLGFQVLHD